MKTKFYIASLYITASLIWLGNLCHAGIEPSFATSVKIQIMDEDHRPVENAKTLADFTHFIKNKDISHWGKTDASGCFSAIDKVTETLLVKAEKDGFYPIRYDDVLIRMDVDSKKIKNVDLPLIMRRIKSPVSLYAKKVNLEIPQEGQPVGFDFAVGDWVKPFGRGTLNDVVFTYNKKFTGYLFEENELDKLRDFSKKSAAVNHEPWTEETFKYDAGKWIGALTLNFQCAKEGIALVDKDYCPYSWLRMPHLAYETGYDATWKREENTFSPRTTKEGIGYFLRSRVKLDEEGKIISANYAKFTSDIQFDPRGRVEFTYVFNPAPNDRNLELNPHANLFKKPTDDERVMFP